MNNRILRAGLSAAAAALGLWGFICSRRTEVFLWTFGNIALLLFLAGAFFGLCYLAFPRITARRLKYTLPLGAFFGLCTACGCELFLQDRLLWSWGGLLEKGLITIGLGGIFTAALLLLFSCTFSKKAQALSPKKLFFISWGAIFICWLPCFIAFYPGILAYDIPTQLAGISEGTLTADHPLLHTLLAWGCFSLGKAIRSYTLGAALYSLVQMLALSASFAGVVAFLRKKGSAPILPWGALAWFALLPIHPLFAVNATKDVLFAACTIGVLLLIARLLQQPERLTRPWFWVVYIFAVVAMALMRNTGIYVFLVFIPVLVFLLPRRRWAALALCLLCVVGFYGGRAALNQALRVQEGRFTEMLSVPLQQMARCAYDGLLSQEDLRELEQYLPEEVWKNYHSRLADPVKNFADREAISKEPMKVVSLWLRLLFKHPAAYIDAFLGLNVGYWYPESPYPDPRIWHAYIETNSKEISAAISVTDPELWPQGRAFYQSIAKGSFQELPLLDLLFKPGIYFWAVLSLLGLSLYHRNRTAGGLLVFLLLSWLLQLLSPIALLRYAYPLMTATWLAPGCFYISKDVK